MFYDLSKFSPESIIVNLVGNVQPPTVDSLFNPIACNIEDVRSLLWITRVELG